MMKKLATLCTCKRSPDRTKILPREKSDIDEKSKRLELMSKKLSELELARRKDLEDEYECSSSSEEDTTGGPGARSF